MSGAPPITLADVRAAARRIAGVVQPTPLLCPRKLSERVGVPVFLKPENLQRTGSFKIRGAYNAVAALSPAARRRGVVTYSSGNHAQALALAAKLFGIPALIVMPVDAPAEKVAGTRALGGKVVFAGRTTVDRRLRAEALQARHGYTMVPPYDHPLVMAGQGTLGLEILAGAEGLEAVLVPVSGGGLIAGVATAVKGAGGKRPPKVIAVEPADADDTARSLRAGRRVSLPKPSHSIADGLRALALGDRPWEVIRRKVDAAVTVTDTEILRAMRFLATEAKLVVEPSGAVGVAALLAGKFRPRGPVAVVLTGGNVSSELFGTLLG